MDNPINVSTYEAPEVLGSFEARDILGAADGKGWGSTITVD